MGDLCLSILTNGWKRHSSHLRCEKEARVNYLSPIACSTVAVKHKQNQIPEERAVKIKLEEGK